VALNTNLGDDDFTDHVPSMKEVKAHPIDTIVGLALLNGLSQKHKVKVNALCQCFDADFATGYLKAHSSYRNKVSVHESLKHLNGLSFDDIREYYKQYAEDIEKLTGDV